MKTLIIGDTHGHDTWKSIITREDPNKVVFLGDYFDSFSVKPQDQAENFKDILHVQDTFGKDDDNKFKMILLLGNHDYHYLLDGFAYSGYNPVTKCLAQPLLERAVKEGRIEIIHRIDNYLLSHAGVSKYWLERVSGVEHLEDINFKMLNLKTLDWNCIIGYSPYGDSISNSPIWIRPQSLFKDAIPKLDQIVGHTELHKITSEISESGTTITLCDTMPRQYLILEGELKIKDNVEE